MTNKAKAKAPEGGGFSAIEYEREPVPENKTKGPGSFLGLFASEHVAATELIIGPLFVLQGATVTGVFGGLLLGNFLAVLTWRYVTAPIATRKRMTLYYQLEKIGGPGIIDIYNFANGILWCCLGGVFIYVSATALMVPEITGLAGPAHNAVLPTGPAMIAIVMGVGLVIAVVAAKGYDAVSRFASIAAPWMVLMFIVIGISALAKLGVDSLESFWTVAHEKVWTGKVLKGDSSFGFWNIVGFAWFGNMAWHFGMGDLSIFRYARKSRYGWISGVGMLLGHYVAWITSGLVFIAQLGRAPVATDTMAAGPMTYEIAGLAGLFLVVLAGWTTANPVIYRAGLAFQAIVPKWSRAMVTFFAGAVASILAVFPLVGNNFLDFAMIYGLSLAPMGGVIFADHYLMKPLGMQEFYAEKARQLIHLPALVAWLLSVALWIGLWRGLDIALTYLCIPSWIFGIVVYLILSKCMQKPVHIQEAAQ